MEKDLTELRAALEQMQRRVESLEAEREDVASQLEARQAPPPPAMAVPQRHAGAHCPFGDVRNFGVRLEGADIRVSPGLAYHAGVPYYTAETLLEKELTELRVALEQMQRRVESLEAELEDVLSQLEARQAPAAPAMAVPQRQAGAHCPFGDVRNFGVRLEGPDIRVYPGLVYHVGVPYYTEETLLEDVEEGDNICVVMRNVDTAFEISVAVEALALDGDHDGDIVRVLGVVAVSGGSARIAKWYGGGLGISAMGG